MINAALQFFDIKKIGGVTIFHVDMIWLVVSTHLKNISQNGNLPQIYKGENKKSLKPPPSYY